MSECARSLAWGCRLCVGVSCCELPPAHLTVCLLTLPGGVLWETIVLLLQVSQKPTVLCFGAAFAIGARMVATGTREKNGRRRARVMHGVLRCDVAIPRNPPSLCVPGPTVLSLTAPHWL